MIGLLLALLLSAGDCQSDDDCTLRTRCSCECCKAPEAMTKKAAEEERRRCSRLGPCGDREDCPRSCPPERPSVAACRDGRCVKVPKPAADAGR